MKAAESKPKMTADLKRCVEFHGHICPGLIYGYRVAREAMKLMKLKRSEDEETVAVCENDSCAIDALQIVLGTVAGKGNLIIQDYGKNAFTVLSRATNQALGNLTPRQCHENYINNQPISHLKNAC